MTATLTQACTGARLHSADWSVLVTLAIHADVRPTFSLPQSAIQRETNLDRRNVQRALRRLTERGLVAVVARGIGNPNEYSLAADDGTNLSTGCVTGDAGGCVTGDAGGCVTGDAGGCVTGDAGSAGLSTGCVTGDAGGQGGCVTGDAGSRARSKEEVHTYLGGCTPTQIPITDSDHQVGSSNEGTREAGAGAWDFTAVVRCLTDAGVPERFLFGQADRGLVGRWLAAGVTRSELELALQRAFDAKTDGEPPGPRYVDRVLQSLRREETHATSRATGADRLRGHAVGDAIGDQWLAEGRQQRAAGGES